MMIKRNTRIIPNPVRLCTRLYEATKIKRDGLGKPKGYSDLSLRYVMEQETLSGLPDTTKPFLVLGIESSCDDTGVAVVRSDGTILSNVVYSQNEIHEKFGGIVPSHRSNIDIAVSEALQRAGLQSVSDVDAIAVTRGPGLEICLRVGFRKAQALALDYHKPFVAVHHLEAHCMMARLAGQQVPASAAEATDATAGAVTGGIPDSSSSINRSSNISSNSSNINCISSINTSTPSAHTNTNVGVEVNTTLNTNTYMGMDVDMDSSSNTLPHFVPKVRFPFLALLASGGHTSLLLCAGLGRYTLLGGTLDDALGEALDKAARLLGLRGHSSGGAAIERMAAQYLQQQADCNAAKAVVAAAAAVSVNGVSNSSVNNNGVVSNSSGAKVVERSGMTVPMRDKANCDFSYAGNICFHFTSKRLIV